MSNDPWRFGYEAIGAMVGALTLVIAVIAEWDKLVERAVIPNIVFFVFVAGGGFAIGYGIMQSALWWRLIGLGLGVILGALFGALFGDEKVYKGRVAVHAVGALAGIVAGLLLAN